MKQALKKHVTECFGHKRVYSYAVLSKNAIFGQYFALYHNVHRTLKCTVTYILYHFITFVIYPSCQIRYKKLGSMGKKQSNTRPTIWTSKARAQIRKKEKRVWFRFATGWRHEILHSYDQTISQRNAITIVIFQVVEHFIFHFF